MKIHLWTSRGFSKTFSTLCRDSRCVPCEWAWTLQMTITRESIPSLKQFNVDNHRDDAGSSIDFLVAGYLPRDGNTYKGLIAN